MNFEELVKSRRSIKSFDSKKSVKLDLVLEGIDVANHIPLAGNIPILKFVVVSDKKLIKKLKDISQQDFVQDCSSAVIVCSNHEQLIRNFDSNGMKFAHQQAGAAIQNFLLFMKEKGVGACWIGHYSDKLLRRAFKIPKKWVVEGVVVVGHPPKVYKPVQSQSQKPLLENSVFFNEWDKEKRKSD